MSEWADRSPEYKVRHAKRQAQRRKDRPDLSLAASVKYRYGVSAAEYEKIKASACWLCGSKNRVVPDHCHKTKRLRKPLCWNCNIALGLFKDNPKLLRKAAAYLEEHR